MLRKSIDLGTGVLLPSDPHAEEITRAETMFVQAEGMIAADPIGAEAVIARSRRSLQGFAHGSGQKPDRSWSAAARPTLCSTIWPLPPTRSGRPRPSSD